MNLKRVAAIPITGIVLALGVSSSANAENPPCDPEQSATGCFGPVTCDYERWYPGVDLCGGQRWSISIKEECTSAKLYNYSWWKHDALCQSFVPKKHYKPKTYVVKRHDTLWRIAVRFTGDGHNWKKIAQRNHVKGTLIYVGQRLVISR